MYHMVLVISLDAACVARCLLIEPGGEQVRASARGAH
jgi:hypothetical protein